MSPPLGTNPTGVQGMLEQPFLPIFLKGGKSFAVFLLDEKKEKQKIFTTTYIATRL
jgi:hypothetical protein